MNIRSGFSIVEALVGAAVLSVVLFGIASLSAQLVRTSFSDRDRAKAIYLSEEGIEAMRFVRDSDWSSFAALSLGVPYDLSISGGSWQPSTSRTMIDARFLRSAVLSSVYRDASGVVVASGGTLDTDSRKLVVTVEWLDQGASTSTRATSTETITTYLDNLF